MGGVVWGSRALVPEVLLCALLADYSRPMGARLATIASQFSPLRLNEITSDFHGATEAKPRAIAAARSAASDVATIVASFVVRTGRGTQQLFV